jgi:hypothetical protein
MFPISVEKLKENALLEDLGMYSRAIFKKKKNLRQGGREHTELTQIRTETSIGFCEHSNEYSLFTNSDMVLD